ncbi:BTB/POZ domain-containing protein [Nannizzia gypsea CBS 118893]|uniref:BTB/POZ domain-containing protein n=1 Tax=Arthroderma gypseum (strain ATCC MYA-4604 / CBS 118893) TaxID=535722 RepID=E4V2L0_ARTGP|nr:BTB/POZ domain-containing protein [Nannizzia gypsea CBS 118893]EFR04275.1 BTB/POZ domain-containing protein [Nannizzia gypsea CBS 118893]
MSTGVPLSEPPKGDATILPHEKVFPIQIGSQLFRLSGASIASDAPSYFSRFFEEQLQNSQDGNVRTLYIDRDPETFHEIVRHLQGYYVRPKDGAHFVKLFADAQFYSLPRLIAQLFECEIFIQIGDRHFQIPRDIFSSPGDSPNFFSLGFAVFFASPAAVFPGLEREGLLRPPSITPPIVSSRSGDVFAELLHLLRGYPVHIRDEEHRACLLRDCRYYHLRGLEQKLIPHDISYNLERRRSEITVRLEDVRPSGITFVHDGDRSSNTTAAANNNNTTGGWVHYARPFVDEDHCELIIEIGGGNTLVDLATMRAELHGLAKARVTSLCQVVANKMNLPTNAPLGLMMMSGNNSSGNPTNNNNTALTTDKIKIHIDSSTDITLDGEPFSPNHSHDANANANIPNNNNNSNSNNHNSNSFQPAEAPAGYTPIEGNISPLTPSALYSRLQTPSVAAVQPNQQLPRKRRRVDGSERSRQWVVDRGQWRLRVHPTTTNTSTNAGPGTSIGTGQMEAVFVAVKLEAHSSQRARNVRRPFVS